MPYFIKFAAKSVQKVTISASHSLHILPNGDEFWVMTEKILSQAQAAHIGFLRKVHEGTLLDRVRSCEIQRLLTVEPLLRIERSQPRWFGYMSRMPHERLARQDLLAKPTDKRSSGSPRAAD